MSELSLLIVEDDSSSLDGLISIAEGVGYRCIAVATPEEAGEVLLHSPFDVVMTDMRGDGGEELDFLSLVRERYPAALVIIVTGSTSIEQAVEAMHRGAFHYLTKPCRAEEVRHLLQRAKERCIMQYELAALRDMVGSREKSHVVGSTRRIEEIKQLIIKVAPLDCTVLIEGETGTGKEFFAKLIHYHSMRADRKFLAVNCGAFNEELLDNELFGHEKEAFTGANRLKQGLFETLDGGTLFLDEIGEMPATAQVKLLRVLQEKTLIRVGGTQEIEVDVRVLAATNRNLREEVAAGRFRQDLFFRLNLITITVPALRDRKDDIPLFCQFFLAKFAKKYGKEIAGLSPEVHESLLRHDWPGNVRELINVIERAVILCDAPYIEPRHLPRRFQGKLPASEACFGGGWEEDLRTLAEVEERYIRRVLEYVGGSKAKAAEILGINRATLWRKLKQSEVV